MEGEWEPTRHREALSSERERLELTDDAAADARHGKRLPRGPTALQVCQVQGTKRGRSRVVTKA